MLDLTTLSLKLVKNVKGSGSSGIPVIPWFIYCYVAALSIPPVPFSGYPSVLFRLLGLTALTGFHVLCQFVLPDGHRPWTKRARRG